MQYCKLHIFGDFAIIRNVVQMLSRSLINVTQELIRLNISLFDLQQINLQATKLFIVTSANNI